MSLDNKLVITNLCADANEAEKCETPTAHKRDGRHDGFRIIMQISQVSVRGQTLKWFPFFLKAVRLNDQVSAPKSHLGTK